MCTHVEEIMVLTVGVCLSYLEGINKMRLKVRRQQPPESVTSFHVQRMFSVTETHINDCK